MELTKFRLLVTLFALFGLALGLEPAPGRQDATAPRQVAIIGAGAAGSTAAYYLRTYAEASGVVVNITIFEKTDRVGGRTLTIHPFGNLSLHVELGASIFIKKNHILYESVDAFKLKPRDPELGADPKLGIWDGTEFVFQINDKDSFWWTAFKIIRKYGILAPRRTQTLMQSTIAKFLKLYEEPYFPFKSLTQRTHELELVQTTGVTGEQFLKANDIDDLYAHDIVQASTRVNYASNLAAIHGLDTMVSMAPEGAMAVEGGNWQIFYKMVENSQATIFFNRSVTAVSLHKPENPGTASVKYTIRIDKSDYEEDYKLPFDNVIIANPYQFSKTSFQSGLFETPIDEIRYVQLHVTIFSSPFQYSPAFFGLSDPKDVPGTILTTLGKDDEPTSGVDGAGKAGFFSISILRKVVNPATEKEEYLYKIFSPEKVTPEFLSRLFGIDVPDTFVDDPAEPDSALSPISWYYPHVFYSYPKALPRVTFQDPIVGPGLYYTSGMESFISTMETNALMGKNVARLIVDDILGVESGGAVEARGKEDEGWGLNEMWKNVWGCYNTAAPTETGFRDL
ncbi:Prenylcysteine lyase-domain-containing protein [Schizothecium vesticola]|uniref:Prenylcysteine lyase-domain-containing protein n=1 Tax=Schizothecium vesticola TaxID=314040 RepID=A0AA40F2X9_9PEZI|nr:Prenylcysteine lyase-domain-containing protein [Schizothecium vesticola]